MIYANIVCDAVEIRSVQCAPTFTSELIINLWRGLMEPTSRFNYRLFTKLKAVVALWISSLLMETCSSSVRDSLFEILTKVIRNPIEVIVD